MSCSGINRVSVVIILCLKNFKYTDGMDLPHLQR